MRGLPSILLGVGPDGDGGRPCLGMVISGEVVEELCYWRTAYQKLLSYTIWAKALNDCSSSSKLWFSIGRTKRRRLTLATNRICSARSPGPTPCKHSIFLLSAYWSVYSPSVLLLRHLSSLFPLHHDSTTRDRGTAAVAVPVVTATL